MKHKTDVSFNKADCLLITMTICQTYGEVSFLYLLPCCQLKEEAKMCRTGMQINDLLFTDVFASFSDSKEGEIKKRPSD